MNNKEIFQRAVENFLCKGGVVLAADDSKSIVGVSFSRLTVTGASGGKLTAGLTETVPNWPG